MTDNPITTNPPVSASSGNVIPFPSLDDAEAAIEGMRLALGDWEPPSNKRWIEISNPLMPATRIAWMLMKKSRGETREILQSLSPEATAEMMYQLAWAGDYFAKLAALCEAAEDRLQAHGAPAAETTWRAEPWPFA